MIVRAGLPPRHGRFSGRCRPTAVWVGVGSLWVGSLLCVSYAPPFAAGAAAVHAADRGAQSSSRRASPLSHRDTPPRGVKRRIRDLEEGGTTACSAPRGVEPEGLTKANRTRPMVILERVPFRFGLRETILEDGSEVAVGEAFKICFEGFDARRPISATMSRPDGTTIRSVLNRYQFTYHSWDYDPLPGDPLGQYTVWASQGARQVARTFVVGPALKPGVRVAPVRPPKNPYSGSGGRPGSDFRLIGSGLPPRRSLMLRVYGPDLTLYDPDPGVSSTLPYLTSIRVRSDRFGGFRRVLRTSTRDRSGCYVIRPAFRAGLTHEDRICL